MMGMEAGERNRDIDMNETKKKYTPTDQLQQQITTATPPDRWWRIWTTNGNEQRTNGK